MPSSRPLARTKEHPKPSNSTDKWRAVHRYRVNAKYCLRGIIFLAFSVALRAADGFNPAATPIAITRIEGVTRCSSVYVHRDGRWQLVLQHNTFIA